MEQNYGIKTRPFVCYFCGKTIENDTEQGHTAVCGHVLEPCPNKCGSYVQRSAKMKHLKECRNAIWKTTPKSTSLETESNHSSESLDRRNGVSPKNYLQNVFERLQKIEHDRMALDRKVDSINRSLTDCQRLKSAQIQLQADLDNCKNQHETVSGWKRRIEMRLEQMNRLISSIESARNQTERTLVEFDSKLGAIKSLKQTVDVLNEALLSEQLISRESLNDLRSKLLEFKDFFAQENALIGALWNDQKLQMENLHETTSNIDKDLNELKAKYASLVFDVRTVTQISTEALEKVEMQEKQNGDMQNEMAQLKVDLERIEQQLSEKDAKFGQNTTGRLLWRLEDFSLKMERAKNDEVVFKSPIFYSHDYGYKLRLLLYLNGIRKWRGRHMLACIHVLKGEHDLLLKWPCKIEGHVILKDLENTDDPKDFSKYITAKRLFGDEENEEPQESSNQYIFVPHTTLLRENFVKNNTVFLEVKMEPKRKAGLETNL